MGRAWAVAGVLAAMLSASPVRAQNLDIAAGVSEDAAARLTEAAEAQEGVLGARQRVSAPRSTGLFAMMVKRFGDDRSAHLFVTPMRDKRVCHTSLASGAGPTLQDALAQCLNALTAAIKAGKAAPDAAPARAPAAAAPAPAAPPARTANWAQVAGVYFRSITVFGVGGIPVPEFEPVVLFKDGSFYSPSDTAIEDLDIAARRIREPRRWGRWSGGGTSFTLTSWGPKARPVQHRLQQGSFFKAYPAEAVNGKLAANYTRVSGGGNSGLGGSVTVGGQTDIRFASDGSFGREGSGGGIAPGVAVASRNRSQGRYAISGYRIEMTGPDGRTQRRFFAVGSKGTPPRVDPQIIFIGGGTHTIMDGK